MNNRRHISYLNYYRTRESGLRNSKEKKLSDVTEQIIPNELKNNKIDFSLFETDAEQKENVKDKKTILDSLFGPEKENNNEIKNENVNINENEVENENFDFDDNNYEVMEDLSEDEDEEELIRVVGHSEYDEDQLDEENYEKQSFRLNSPFEGFKSKHITLVEANEEKNIWLYNEDDEAIDVISSETWMFHDGKIKRNADSIEVYTTNSKGETVKGIVKCYDYNEIAVINRKDLEELTNIYEVHSITEDDFVLIYKTPDINKEEIIGKLNDGDYILGKIEDIKNEECGNWVATLQIIDGEAVRGFVKLENVTEIRTSDNDYDESNEDSESNDWTEADNTNDNYENDESKEEVVERIINNTKPRNNDLVVGVDISYIKPDNLKKILMNSNAIPSRLNGNYMSNLDTSDISGKIDFVILRIGTSSHDKKFSIIRNKNQENNIKQCIDVLEKSKTPYGFYYYSTANTKQEADEELEYINSITESSKNKNYNLIPFSIDREQYSYIDQETGEVVEASRINNIDGTEVVAYEMGELRNKYNNVFLYANGEDLSKEYGIIDLEKLENLTGHSTEIWTPATKLEEYNLNEYTNTYLNLWGKNIKHIVLTQTIVDACLKEDANYDNIVNANINTMKFDDFKKVLKSGSLN